MYDNKGKEAHLNINRIHERLFATLDHHYKRWQEIGGQHGAMDGLGKLFLWKLMAPKTNPTTITYFNGQLVPTYTGGSKGLIKLGMNFIAKTHQIPESHKNIYLKWLLLRVIITIICFMVSI